MPPGQKERQNFRKKIKKTLAIPGSLWYDIGAIEMTGVLRLYHRAERGETT